MITFSRFNRATDNVPKSETLSVENLTLLLADHKPRSDKDGPLWSPTVYREGTKRGNANVEYVTCFVADVDNGVSPYPVWHHWWSPSGEQLLYQVHSSYSSTIDKPKWRVVFPLAKSVPASEWAQVHRKLATILMDGNTDPACKDAARIYYLPAYPIGGESNVFTYGCDGVLLDPDAFPEPADESVAAAAMPHMVKRAPVGSGAPDGKPGADFNAAATADSVLAMLCQMGWKENARRPDGVIEVTRPGKKDGLSGTIGYAGDMGNTFYCFTSSASSFQSSESYTPFAVYARLHCGGSFAEAAKRLGSEGFGEQLPPTVQMSIDKYDLKPSAPVEKVAMVSDDPFEEAPAPKKPVNKKPAESPDDLNLRCASFPQTDLGNAERIIARHGQDMRHSEAFGWLTWDGSRWTVDEARRSVQLAKKTIRCIREEQAAVIRKAAKTSDDEKKKVLDDWSKSLLAFAIKSESARSLTSALLLAETEPGVHVPIDALNADPFLLTVLNGTIDLRTGKLRPSDRADLCTKRTPIKYDLEAKCPIWDKFLERIVPDETIRAYLARVIGYGLTGSIREQELYFLHGPTQTGKSTFTKTAVLLVGDFGLWASDELLVAQRSEMIRDDLANLAGMRMVATVETDEGKTLAEGLMKKITGGDKIRARLLYKNGFEFTPTHKILFASNHKPNIRNGADGAIWRRIRLIPFEQTIPESEKDDLLDEKLAEELPGILAWAVRGCLEWQKNGMQTPDAVKAKTEEYRDESDTIGQFLGESCYLGGNAQVAGSKLYDAYTAWAEKRKERPKTLTSFARVITERPNIYKKRENSGVFYYGIGLLETTKTEPENPFPSEGEI